MCGRYAIQFEEENIAMREIFDQINQRYTGSAQIAKMKTGEIFPTDTVPVITLENVKPIPRLMNWGFPKWNVNGVIINARAETAMEKNMFRPSLLERRCIIPSTGFYEWQHQENTKSKTKYILYNPKNPMLYMAGFYNMFKEKDGQITTSFVILTTQANQSVSPIHNRMPLILESENTDLWLTDRQAALALLNQPCRSLLESRAVI